MQQETVKLLNVLRRIARSAGYAAWVKPDPEAARFCVSQYNKILNRLREVEPGITSLFTPLAEDASPEVVRMAARELLAYFEVDSPDLFAWSFGRPFAFGCYPRRGRRARCFSVPVRCD